MNIKIKYKWVRYVFLSLLSVALTSCAIGLPRHWPAKIGQVLDTHTKKPIKDVYLVAKWTGYGGVVGVRTICYHVESSKTDDNGQFMIPEFYEGFGDASYDRRHAIIYLYAPGYIESKYHRSSYYKQKKYFLEKFIGTTKERFSYFTHTARSQNCHDAGESNSNVFAAYKAIYNEAKLLAKTTEEKNDVNWLKILAASKVDRSYEKFTGHKRKNKINQIINEH